MEVDSDEEEAAEDVDGVLVVDAVGCTSVLSIAMVVLPPKRDRLRLIKAVQRLRRNIPDGMKATFDVLAKLFLHIFMAKCR